MICPKCNFENDSDARFCEKCGSELKQPKVSSPQKKSKRRRIAIIVTSVHVALISIIVGVIFHYYGLNFNSAQFSVSGSENGHAYVDLGLSSGTLWATCNVGASYLESYGSDYYAWGETNTKHNYSWDTYKYYDSRYHITKYCTDCTYGIVDNKTMLDLSDDAAHVNWGGAWRIPTHDEWNELLSECEWTWGHIDRTGYKVTGPNGNSIFLPAAGSIHGDQLYESNLVGNYSCSSLYHSKFSFSFGRGNHNYFDNRCNGYSVRPVCSPR